MMPHISDFSKILRIIQQLAIYGTHLPYGILKYGFIIMCMLIILSQVMTRKIPMLYIIDLLLEKIKMINILISFLENIKSILSLLLLVFFLECFWDKQFLIQLGQIEEKYGEFNFQRELIMEKQKFFSFFLRLFSYIKVDYQIVYYILFAQMLLIILILHLIMTLMKVMLKINSKIKQKTIIGSECKFKIVEILQILAFYGLIFVVELTFKQNIIYSLMFVMCIFLKLL
ncbi:hypothetical protein IMG5_178750 [Ichthyophthirius multifiliis]|uniref:Transmembrane protein n=1 Tax=Ichthyophthirius multifiliis TaxID=5932 RepID=G0R2J2_ICHMU|nr:hypothetical protein IMG5_178750 [Ichthyophthirius multifiliis]EGR28313.1 hypothetical protein IMG5_178750 [Ichthyophthirius multifiliis]|eukprot:XP_004027658.1 hypothetical protein IMG5_178750 [Ichthyophthirius multifiliis]